MESLARKQVVVKPRAVIRITNPDTGEYEDVSAIVLGRDPKYIDKGFVKIFVAFLSDLVQDKELTAGPVRLLLWLIEKKLDYNTLQVEYYLEEAAKALNISLTTAKRWNQILVRKKILRHIGSKSYGRYKLIDYSAVKGSMQRVN
jgi:hypothetical protein